MIPQEKTKDLVEQFIEHTVEWDKIKEVAFDSEFHAKQCALIAVDEILDELSEIVMVTSSKYIIKHINYYQEVKQEIEKL